MLVSVGSKLETSDIDKSRVRHLCCASNRPLESWVSNRMGVLDLKMCIIFRSFESRSLRWLLVRTVRTQWTYAGSMVMQIAERWCIQLLVYIYVHKKIYHSFTKAKTPPAPSHPAHEDSCYVSPRDRPRAGTGGRRDKDPSLLGRRLTSGILAVGP